MSETVREINEFFRTALKRDVDDLKDKLSLSERQDRIFCMYYIKRNDINFIGDSLGVCPQVVGKELRNIRKKIIRLI